jgi:putative phage-type endonuclease
MPITDQQKELRRKHIGSSDMAAILGIDPFRNAYDVWLEKTGKVDSSDISSEAAEIGNALETGILNLAERRLGKILRNQYRSAKDKRGLPLGANIDGLVIASNEPIDAKTSGITGPLFGNWGDEGTDQVPDHIITQAHVHMLCVDKDICHIAAVLGGRGFQLFHVPEDKELRNIICEKAIEFWDKHVQADVPPANVTPSALMIKRIIREPNSVVDVPDELVQKWLDAQQAKRDAEKMCDAAQAEVLTALGQAECGNCSFGQVTYFEQSRSGIDAKALKDQLPEIAAQFANITKYRVARFKKAK